MDCNGIDMRKDQLDEFIGIIAVSNNYLSNYLPLPYKILEPFVRHICTSHGTHDSYARIEGHRSAAEQIHPVIRYFVLHRKKSPIVRTL